MLTVELEFEQKTCIFNCRKTTKIKKILYKFAKLKNLNINKLFFLKSSSIISSNEDFSKRFEEILNKDDSKEGKIHILVEEQQPELERTFSDIKLSKNDLEDSLINEDDENKFKKYKMFIKLYFFLFIKFFFITIIVGSCIYFEINNKYIIIDKRIILAIFIFSALILFIISISLFFVSKERRHFKKIYIFSFLYNLSIIINCMILSKYINYKFIMICLFLIILHIFSIEAFILIFKVYNYYGFLFTPIIINISCIIILHFFYIKNLYQTIYISAFIIFIIISHFIIFYILIYFYKTINYKEYIFISIIISLSIINIIGLGVYYFYFYIKSNIENNNLKYIFYLKLYLIEIIEFMFIFIIFYLGFYYKINIINNIVNGNLNIFLVKFILILFLICISLFILLSFNGIIKDIIIFFIFIFCIIISLFLLSKYFDKNIILYCLIIILSNSFSIELYLIFNCFNKKYEITFIFISFIVITLSIFLLYKFWIKEFKDIIFLSKFGVFLFIFNNLCHFLLFDFYNYDNIFFKVIIMHLSIFAFIYMVIYKIQEHIHSIYNKNITIKIYLFILNFFLLIQYIIIICFIDKFQEKNKVVHIYISKYIIYNLLIFAIPPFLFYCPCFINKNSSDNWKTHFSLCINILCYIINIPIMIYLYLLLLYYLGKENITYLLSFIIALILVIEIYALLFTKFRRAILILFPLIICICLSLLFYSNNNKISKISYILASLYYINIITSEYILSNSCNYDSEPNLNCNNCNNYYCIKNRQGFNLKFYDIFYSISFINLIKFSPLALIYVIPLDLIRIIVFPFCKTNNF